MATSFTGRLEVTADLSGLTGTIDFFKIVFAGIVNTDLLDRGYGSSTISRSRYNGYN